MSDMNQITQETSKCIRCDDEVQTYGMVEDREYEEFIGPDGAYLVCEGCWEEVQGRSFA